MKQENCTFCEGTGQIVSSTTISGFKTCDCKLIKLQAKRMYNEEDMKQFGLYLGDNFKKLKGKSIDEIFTTFKQEQ